MREEHRCIRAVEGEHRFKFNPIQVGELAACLMQPATSRLHIILLIYVHLSSSLTETVCHHLITQDLSFGVLKTLLSPTPHLGSNAPLPRQHQKAVTPVPSDGSLSK